MRENIRICVVGLGYVGLPLAIAFAEKDFSVIGFDLNQEKIKKYLEGIDPTNEVGNDKIKNSEFKNDIGKSSEEFLEISDFDSNIELFIELVLKTGSFYDAQVQFENNNFINI